MQASELLARNMKRIRKECGVTQEHLAESCGLHRTYIGAIEQKRVNVCLANIQKIADALGVKVTDLFAEDVPTAPAVLDAAGNVVRLGDFALCTFSDDEVSVSPLDMKDPDLGAQILISLIQSGITDEKKLAKEYKKTERALLRYMKADLV